MPQFTIRWANRGTSPQDWNVQNRDPFHLDPDYVLTEPVNLNANRTYNIAVDTVGPHPQFAAATLTYTAAANTWAIASNTPAEWQLATGNGFVTLRCLLSDPPAPVLPEYSASDPRPDAG
ncbi:MAG TPA: hypothetical protein VE913_14490 [Longimicrobium sp.]|nr:hypothetical protein [Longimicrobium sp.]